MPDYRCTVCSTLHEAEAIHVKVLVNDPVPGTNSEERLCPNCGSDCIVPWDFQEVMQVLDEATGSCHWLGLGRTMKLLDNIRDYLNEPHELSVDRILAEVLAAGPDRKRIRAAIERAVG